MASCKLRGLGYVEAYSVLESFLLGISWFLRSLNSYFFHRSVFVFPRLAEKAQDFACCALVSCLWRGEVVPELIMKLHRHRLDACSQKMHFNRDANLKPLTTTETLQKAQDLKANPWPGASTEKRLL